MLLHALADYGRRLEAEDDPAQRLPAMYQRVPIRYIIKLDRKGQFLGLIDTATSENKRGTVRMAPDRKRTVTTRPKLLSDITEYTLGIVGEEGNPDRMRQRHAAYVALITRCAQVTQEPTVAAVARFLETLALDADRLALPPDFDPSATLTFDVDGIYPIALPAVQTFWAQEASVTERDGDELECLVCGTLQPIPEMLPVSIKGIPRGQSAGTQLLSANSVVFESYGLPRAQTSPVCEPCGLLACNALNRLLREDDTHLVTDDVVYVFWTREPVRFSWVTLLSHPEPDEVRRLLSAAWRGSAAATALETTPFYAATLSATNARVVVRDWIETTLGQAQRNLQRYFRLQRLIDGLGEDHYVSLWQLQRATSNSRANKEKPPVQVGQALMRVALQGGVAPEWLLYQAVRRTHAEQGVSSAHAALIKLALLTQHAESGGEEDVNETRAGHDLAALDADHPAPAYHCGRLLAELEAIQRAALGYDLSATVVDRYFGTASSAPASVFGRLLRGAQPHLSKLHRDKRGLWSIFNERLQDITSHIETFPRTLTLREQGLFALGFYHQRAADVREQATRRQAREAKVIAGQTAVAVEEEWE